MLLSQDDESGSYYTFFSGKEEDNILPSGFSFDNENVDVFEVSYNQSSCILLFIQKLQRILADRTLCKAVREKQEIYRSQEPTRTGLIRQQGMR